jgi:actin-like ATPase involved in cell morphogenesis
MFTQKIAIDLGTANTIIIVDGQIVVDEPSVVAIRRKDETMVAVGRKAAADWRRAVGAVSVGSDVRWRTRDALRACN